MKRYYQNRFILGAMLAFLILMIVTITGIWLFSYRQMERDTNTFIQDMLNLDTNSQHSFFQPAPPPMFGYTPDQRRYPSGFYDILMNEDGSIQSIQQHGIVEEAGINVQQVVQQAVSEKTVGGKIGSYKYSIAFREDGTARIILLDISIQLQALYNMLKSALMVGAALTVVLLLILLPVSSRVAKAFMRNAEKQKRFITDAGHDLKTPIAIMRSNLDVMELTQGKSKWSDNIRSQANRLEHLVGQLLMMARLEESEIGDPTVCFDFSELLREQWQAYATRFEQKHAAADIQIPDNITMRGRKEYIQQLTDLLLDNAAQYMDDHGRFFLSASSERKTVRVRIQNTVEQLPAQQPDELTERFARGDTARNQKSGGSGIGLSAAKRITEMHRGRLEVSYPDSHAFCVTVELPAVKNESSRFEEEA